MVTLHSLLVPWFSRSHWYPRSHCLSPHTQDTHMPNILSPLASTFFFFFVALVVLLLDD